MLKTVLLLNIFVKTLMHFCPELHDDLEGKKKLHLNQSHINLMYHCTNINVFNTNLLALKCSMVV